MQAMLAEACRKRDERQRDERKDQIEKRERTFWEEQRKNSEHSGKED